MPVLSRVGFAITYMATIMLGGVFIQAFGGRLDTFMMITGVLLLAVGLPLLLSTSLLARELRWRVLWSASPTGRIGMAFTLVATVTLVSTVRYDVANGDPFEWWWQYLVIGVVALVLSLIFFLIRPPLEQPRESTTRNIIR